MTAPQNGWEQHERAQRQAWLALTPAQRLRWLWSAKLFAAHAAEAGLTRKRVPKAGL